MYLRIVIIVCAALYMAPLASVADDNNGLYAIDGVPLYIDGAQSTSHPPALSPALLDQVKNASTLGDALRILGPAYIEPNDNLHIAHWHFQNGFMLTEWPQGNESLDDPITVYPRPDCGVPADSCMDLVLGRKNAQKKKHGGGGSGGGGGSSSLMHLFSVR